MDVDEDVVSDDDAMEFALADEEPVATKAYECMSRDEIITQQTKAINKISDVLSLPFSTARILLQFCMVRWTVPLARKFRLFLRL
jgi:hypothetical protein